MEGPREGMSEGVRDIAYCRDCGRIGVPCEEIDVNLFLCESK